MPFPCAFQSAIVDSQGYEHPVIYSQVIKDRQKGILRQRKTRTMKLYKEALHGMGKNGTTGDLEQRRKKHSDFLMRGKSKEAQWMLKGTNK